MSKSRYRPEYNQYLLDHMKQGKSFNTFSAVVDVHPSTIKRWLDEFPEFKECYEIGQRKALLFWEEQLAQGAMGETKANASLMIFKLKNEFGDFYKDKQEVEVNKATTIVIQTGIPRGLEQNVIETIEHKPSRFIPLEELEKQLEEEVKASALDIL